MAPTPVYAAAGLLCALVGVAVALVSDVAVVFGSCIGGALLVLSRLDGWRRLYAATLVLMVGVTSSVPGVAQLAFYPRFLALAALLAWTVVAHRESVPLRDLAPPARWLLRALWGIVVVATASVVWSVAPLLTAQQAVVLAAFVGLLHALITRRWVKRDLIGGDLATAFVTLNAVFAVGLIASYASLEGTRSYTGRLQGLFDNPNTLGMTAAVTAMLGMFLIARSPAYLVGVGFAVGSLFLTQSRTAALALLVGLLCLLLRAGGKRIALLYGTAVAAIVAFPFLGLLLEGTKDGLISRVGSTEGGSRLNGRDVAWSAAWRFWTERPSGYGLGTTEVVFTDRLGLDGFYFQSLAVHNSYLQLLLELGPLGQIPLIVALAVLVVTIFRCRQAALAATVVTGLTIQIAESSIFGTGQVYPYVFWLVAAAAVLNWPAEAAQDTRQVVPARTAV